MRDTSLLELALGLGRHGGHPQRVRRRGASTRHPHRLRRRQRLPALLRRGGLPGYDTEQMSCGI